MFLDFVICRGIASEPASSASFSAIINLEKCPVRRSKL